MSNLTLVTWQDLRSRGITFSQPTIYRKIKDGSFPRPLKIGANRIAWLESEISDWIEAIAAARNSSPA
jgi:prophage regulatory protein